MADTTTATNSGDNAAQTFSDSPTGQSISSISADTTTTNSLTNNGVIFLLKIFQTLLRLILFLSAIPIDMFIHCSFIFSINLQKCNMCGNTYFWSSDNHQLFWLFSNQLYYRTHIYISQWFNFYSCDVDYYNNRCNIKQRQWGSDLDCFWISVKLDPK